MTGAAWTILGTKGDGVNQFSVPPGMFVDWRGRVYVTDQYNDRIVRVDEMTRAGWTSLGYDARRGVKAIPSTGRDLRGPLLPDLRGGLG